MGVRELILIAQDTTDYGHDLGMKDGLAQLLEKLVQAAPEIDWIRIMYAYPGYVTDRLIEVMADTPADRALPGYAAAACPPRYAAPHAPPGQHGLGVPHPGQNARGPARSGLAHHLHRRLSRRDRRGIPDPAGFHRGNPLRLGRRLPVLLRAGHHQRAARRPNPSRGQARNATTG